jgi:flagellar basal-body rod protein FlgF|tara:strand:+ start:23631 stop:24395 length:765 start_codon:yes stop_codon:yes gene_type:complete
MDRLAFISLAGITSQAEIRAQITNGLANVSTVGFKESLASVDETLETNGLGFNTRVAPSSPSQEFISLAPGTINSTGRAMDIAMTGNTVLGVQADNGDIGFTRRGDLRVTANGVVENAAGHLVLGETGPINVPPGHIVSISPDGTVFGSLPTEPDVPALNLGQLMLRDATEMPLIRRADALFEPFNEQFRGRDFPTGPQPAALTSGTLEGSNVNPIEAMVKMMDFSRSYEAKIKLISEIKSIDENGASMMRLPK